MHTPSVTLNDTNISAGPGDDIDATSNILVPAMNGDATEGATLDLVEEIDVVSSDTPSMELKAAETPADAETETAAEAESPDGADSSDSDTATEDSAASDSAASDSAASDSAASDSEGSDEN